MKNQWKPILIVGGLLIVLLTAIVQSNAAPSASQPTVPASLTATLPPSTSTTYSTLTPLPTKELSQCVFPLADVLTNSTDSPDLQNYIFLDPQVVLTSTMGFRIVQWISNEEALILKSIPGQKDVIEIVNVKNGKEQKINEGKMLTTPLWTSTQKALAYLRYDEERKKWDLIYQKVGGEANILEHNTRLPVLLVDGGKGAIAYSIDQDVLRGKAIEPSGQKTMQFAFASYKEPVPAPYEWVYNTAISPNERWQAVFNIEHFLLFDSAGQIQEFSFGKWQIYNRWVLNARWDPDGKYLALQVTAGRLPVSYDTLLILNVEKQCTWEIPLSRPFSLYEMAWSPGGRYLLVSGSVGLTKVGYPLREYRLLDLVTGQERKVNLWNADTGGGDFDWSPDGKTILTNCVTSERADLCTVAVEMKP